METQVHDQIQQWAERIAASDNEAFDALFRATYKDYVLYAMRYTKQQSSANDIVQDVFVKLWQKRTSIDPEKSLLSYLYQMVRNRALNDIRDNARVDTGLELHTLTTDPQQDDSEADGEFDLGNKMKKWIKLLPQRQQEAFELSRTEGLDHEEIANIMGVAVRTVNNHIMGALKQLRKHYEAYQTKQSTGKYG